MKKLKSKIIIFNIIFLFCLVICMFVKFIRIDLVETPLEEENLPLLSNNGINVITPENITYSESMSGYYPATYGFENDITGSIGTEISFIDYYYSAGTFTVINDEIGGHKKILKLIDQNNTDIVVVDHNITQTYGTWEFWIQTNDTSQRSHIRLYSGGSPVLFVWIKMEDNKWIYHNGVGWVDVPNVSMIQNNTWYHVRIDFRCDGETTIWQGLSQNRWQLIIDGVSSGELNPRTTKTSITKLRLVTDATDEDYCFYIDAIGFSWDPNYNIGDNLNEGLLLSFENQTALDWQGYSLDAQSNRTILGNTTIPIPEDDVHTIQVFGSDNFGTDYQSDIRYFTVDFPIDIITPEAKTYNKAMDGYYPGIHGFENTKNGSIPEDWIFFSDDPSGDAESFVIDEVDGHNNVIKLKHGGTISTNTYVIAPSFNPNQISVGTVEWWMYYEDNGLNHGAAVSINQGFPWGSSVIVGLHGDGSVMYYNGAVQSFYGIGTYDLDTWHHFKVDLDCSTDKFNLTVNRILIVPNIDFPDDIDYIDMLRIVSNQFSNCTVYYDAFGYSWEPGYKIGDNLNEGLLLSFKNSTALNWTGYTLDGFANKTIMGNNTIPLPCDGSHVIRVFGNDTSGTIYESNIRRFSVHRINIDTPENKTYIKPMSGYFPATYGFENDDVGNSPEGWVKDDVGAGYVEVYPAIGGHTKIVIISDQDTNQYSLTRTVEQDQEFGTIEYWIYMTDVNQINLFQYRNSSGDTMMNYRVESNKWQYRTTVWTDMKQSNGVDNMPAPSVNAWYHVRIDFECGSGGYLGLNPDRYKVIIDGISSQELPFQFNGTSLHDINCRTDGTHNGYSYYVDAFGFSWDPNYNIGDNIYEGLLLSFENSTVLNWTGYSLDYQPVKTILGNTTFPMPENGLHTIQIFGNDSIGTNYNSEIRYFTVDYQPIRIITPENKTYIEPMSGYYPATYGFENDEKGTIPDKWVDSSGSGCSVEVMKELDGHKKIVDFNDTFSGGAATLIQDFPIPQIYGTIELWIRISDVADSFILYLDNSTTVSIFPLQLFEGKWKWYNSSIPDFAEIPGLPDPKDNVWHHVRLDFECSSNGYMGLSQNYFKVTIDGIESNPLNFQKYSTEVTRITLRTDGGLSNYHAYVDALGYSWDPNYNVGDNIYEGILLSFENSPAFNWIGYSLDSEPINTIIGNTTFPMPEEGVYKIQVFGNDSFGINYQSNVRYFSLDLNAPNISINSPRFNELFGSAAPFFNITIIELFLDSMWYTLDAGLINLTITEPTGMINQTEWNNRPNGTVSIRFYANDTVGFFGYEEVAIKKDVIPPEITINSPYQDQIFRDQAPSFNISINEGNLEDIWYTLDDGLVNITCGTSERILQEYWNALRPGDYILKFYANDTLGNLGFSEVPIKKREQVISVYNPILISLISITGIAVIIHKIKKKLD